MGARWEYTDFRIYTEGEHCKDVYRMSGLQACCPYHFPAARWAISALRPPPLAAPERQGALCRASPGRVRSLPPGGGLTARLIRDRWSDAPRSSAPWAP